MKRICVIDGQGGGIGSALIRGLKTELGETVDRTALGTNAIATAQMLKAGANRGATGENAICKTVARTDVIIGTVAITWPNAMLGELTPSVAEAIMSSPAKKILLPLSQENAEIIGLTREPLPHLVEEAVEKIKMLLERLAN